MTISLIDKMREAVNGGSLQQPFTMESYKVWLSAHSVTKQNGTPYSAKTINAQLSNYDSNNFPTTNCNAKVLGSRLNESGKKEYLFLA